MRGSPSAPPVTVSTAVRFAASKWSLVERDGTVATKRDGKHAIVMAIRYLDLGNQSAFALDVSSLHSLDFLTFNNLGANRLPAAIEAAQAWLDSFRTSHAADLVQR